MLGNYSGVGALGGDSLDQVVTEYGGGYVLSDYLLSVPDRLPAGQG